MTGTLPPETKVKWQEQNNYITSCLHLYKVNCYRNPYCLMYGRHPYLPIHIEFRIKLPDITVPVTHEYVQKLCRRLEWTYKKACEISRREIKHHKKHYDCKTKCFELEPCDLVLIRQKAF